MDMPCMLQGPTYTFMRACCAAYHVPAAYLFVSFGDIPGGSLADTLNAGLPLPCQYRAYLVGESLYSRYTTYQVQLFTNGQATYSGE